MNRRDFLGSIPVVAAIGGVCALVGTTKATGGGLAETQALREVSRDMAQRTPKYGDIPFTWHYRAVMIRRGEPVSWELIPE